MLTRWLDGDKMIRFYFLYEFTPDLLPMFFSSADWVTEKDDTITFLSILIVIRMCTTTATATDSDTDNNIIIFIFFTFSSFFLFFAASPSSSLPSSHYHSTYSSSFSYLFSKRHFLLSIILTDWRKLPSLCRRRRVDIHIRVDESHWGGGRRRETSCQKTGTHCFWREWDDAAVVRWLFVSLSVHSAPSSLLLHLLFSSNTFV